MDGWTDRHVSGFVLLSVFIFCGLFRISCFCLAFFSVYVFSLIISGVLDVLVFVLFCFLFFVICSFSCFCFVFSPFLPFPSFYQWCFGFLFLFFLFFLTFSCFLIVLHENLSLSFSFHTRDIQRIKIHVFASGISFLLYLSYHSMSRSIPGSEDRCGGDRCGETGEIVRTFESITSFAYLCYPAFRHTASVTCILVSYYCCYYYYFRQYYVFFFIYFHVTFNARCKRGNQVDGRYSPPPKNCNHQVLHR